MICWVLGGAITLGMTYILMKDIKVIVNIKSLLSVRDRLRNGNLVKFCLWCPLSSLPRFLLQAVQVEKGDGCRQRERKPSISCCSIKGTIPISKVSLKPCDPYFRIWLLATKSKCWVPEQLALYTWSGSQEDGKPGRKHALKVTLEAVTSQTPQESLMHKWRACVWGEGRSPICSSDRCTSWEA